MPELKTSADAGTTVIIVCGIALPQAPPHGFRDFRQSPELRGSALLLLPAAQVANAFGLLTPAIEETVHGTSEARFFQPLSQCLAASMKFHGDIVQRGAEARGNSLARFAEDVGTPDDIGIARLERRQQLVKAVTYHPVGLWVERYSRSSWSIAISRRRRLIARRW
jgi:hypothetical protein